MECHWNRFNESGLLTGTNPLLTEFGIHHRLESCALPSVANFKNHWDTHLPVWSC